MLKNVKKCRNRAVAYKLALHYKSEWCVKNIFAKIFCSHSKNPCACLLGFVQLQKRG